MRMKYTYMLVSVPRVTFVLKLISVPVKLCVCMYMDVHTCECIYVRVDICIFVHTHDIDLNALLRASSDCEHVCIYINIYTGYIYIDIRKFMYAYEVHIHARFSTSSGCEHVCIFINMYTCVCILTHV